MRWLGRCGECSKRTGRSARSSPLWRKGSAWRSRLAFWLVQVAPWPSHSFYYCRTIVRRLMEDSEVGYHIIWQQRSLGRVEPRTVDQEHLFDRDAQLAGENVDVLNGRVLLAA